MKAVAAAAAGPPRPPPKKSEDEEFQRVIQADKSELAATKQGVALARKKILVEEWNRFLLRKSKAQLEEDGSFQKFRDRSAQQGLDDLRFVEEVSVTFNLENNLSLPDAAAYDGALLEVLLLLFLEAGGMDGEEGVLRRRNVFKNDDLEPDTDAVAKGKDGDEWALPPGKFGIGSRIDEVLIEKNVNHGFRGCSRIRWG